MAQLRHFVARFFESLRAKPLSPAEQSAVSELLRPSEAAFFWRQPLVDQRHGWNGALAVRAVSSDRTLERAALLHDVGKSATGLGVLGRSLASGLELFRLPMTRRMHRYLAHGDTGAAMLAAAGAERAVVLFAAHHHGERPADISESDWDLLQAADAETKHRPWPNRPLR